MKTILFASSLRPFRANDRVLKLVTARLTALGRTVDIVDPKDTKLSILQTPLQYYGNPNNIPSELHKLSSFIKKADMLMFTTCEYFWSTPPGLSNLPDNLLPDTLAYKAAGIIGYSPGFNGASLSSANLAQRLIQLGCLVVPHRVYLGRVNERVSEGGDPMGSEEQCCHMTAEIDLVIKQITYVAQRLLRQKPTTPRPRLHPYC
ncbi:unnamed protein product [Calicophoron daubneyi]|uniref:NADPH-dependent FMN reductase-like domain-containing protein n=1 Tax=Calicophoron daubneyi TaxID=300641 RepID=A0AAV2TT62_CALDB